MHHVGHHVEESRVVIHGLRTADDKAELVGDFGGFVVEIVEHFDVVADEPDRAQDGRFEPLVRCDARR